MKKKILCFIFAFIFMFPLAFMLGGCLGENPPADPPPTEQGGEEGSGEQEQEQPALTVDQVLKGFLDAQDVSNYTARINLEYSEKLYEVKNNIAGAGKTNGISLPTISVLNDNLNSYINAPSLMEQYIIDGESYYKDLTRDEDDFTYTNFISGDQEYLDMMIEFINKILDKNLVPTIASISNILNSNSVKVVEEDNTVTLKINLDLADFLNKSLTNIILNNSKELKFLLNTFYKDFTGNEGDILNLIEEFKQIFTDQTTVQDLFDFIYQKSGVDIYAVANYFYNFYRLYNLQENSASGWNYLENVVAFYRYDNDLDLDIIAYNKYDETAVSPTLEELGWDNAKDTPLVETVDTTDTNMTAKELFFENLESLFNNPDVTLSSFLQSSLSEDEFEMYQIILEAWKGTTTKNCVLDLGFVLDKEYNIQAVNASGNFEYTLVDPQTKDGDGYKYLFDLSVDFSDIGETVVKLPSEIVYDYVSVNYTIKASQLENLSTNFVKSLGHLTVDIPSFTAVGYEYVESTQSYLTTPITLLSYNSTTKLISFNSEYLLEAFAVEDCNVVQFSILINDVSYEFNIYIEA